MMKEVKLIVSDMDGTLIKYSCGIYGSSWEAVAHAIGKGGKSERLLDYYMYHKDLYGAWVIEFAKLLTNVPTKRVTEKIFPTPYIDGVQKTFSELKSEYPQIKTGILTNGVDIVAKEVAKDLDMDFFVANELEANDGRFTGIAKCNVDLWKKDDALMDIAKKYNASADEICFIGDNENDIPCFDVCGYGIAFQPKTELVKRHATKSADDFSEIKNILKKLIE